MKVSHGLRGWVNLWFIATLLLMSACTLRAPATAPTATAGPAIIDAATDASVPLKAIPPSATPAPSATQAQVSITPQVAADISTTFSLTGKVRLDVRLIAGADMLKPSHSILSLTVDGLNSAKDPVHEDLHVEHISTDKLRQQSTVITGSLATRTVENITRQKSSYEIVEMGSYYTAQNAYWAVRFSQRDAPYCIKMTSNQDILRGGTPPETVLHITQRALYGQPLGEETVNGIATRHYRIDPAATNAAALIFEDAATHKRVTELQVSGGDVYLAVEGNYVVRLAINYDGMLSEYNMTGKVRMNYNLTNPSPAPIVQAPHWCDAAPAMDEAPQSFGQANKLDFGTFTGRAPAGRTTSAITITMKGKDLAGNLITGDLIMRHAENLTQQHSVHTIEGSRMAEMMKLTQAAAVSIKAISVYKINGDYFVLIQGKRMQDTYCMSTKSVAGIDMATLIDPDIELGLLTQEWLLYGVSLGKTTAGNIMRERFKLDADATNEVMEQMYGASANRPALVQGAAIMAHRKFTVADITNGTTPDGRDLVYMQHLETVYNGAYKSLDFTGRLTATYDFALPEGGVEIVLPPSCLNATSS